MKLFDIIENISSKFKVELPNPHPLYLEFPPYLMVLNREFTVRTYAVYRRPEIGYIHKVRNICNTYVLISKTLLFSDNLS